MHAVIISIFH